MGYYSTEFNLDGDRRIHVEIEYDYSPGRMSLDWYEPDDPPEVEITNFWVTDFAVNEDYIPDRLLTDWGEFLHAAAKDCIDQEEDDLYMRICEQEICA